MCLTLLANCCYTQSRHQVCGTLLKAGQHSSQQFRCRPAQSGVRNRAPIHTKAALLPDSGVLASLSAAHLPPMLQQLASPAALAVSLLGLIAVYAWNHARQHSRRSELILQRTSFNKGVLSRCPTINSAYQTWPFLSNGHVETIFASKLRRNPSVSYSRESFETPDGGTVHIDYHNLPSTIVSTQPHSECTDTCRAMHFKPLGKLSVTSICTDLCS